MSINFNNLKPSASMEVAKTANKMKAEGKKVFPLGIGDTHFSPPKVISNNLKKLPVAYSHYTNAEGLDQLLFKISKLYKTFSKNDVILVPGLKQGLYYCLAALKSKKLCILEPAWLGYDATATLVGCKTIKINIFNFSWKKKLIDKKFDSIILCSPNNPDGKIFSKEDIDFIIEIASKNNAWIITDFIYDNYIYEKNKSNYFDNLYNYNKLIIGNGFSKSHAMTGFRVGYLLCKDTFISDKILILQQNLATCTSSIAQFLLLNFEEAQIEIINNSNYYKKNRDIVIKNFPEWNIFLPKGGFYFFVDLARYGIFDGEKFCKNILQDTGIVLVPGNAYGKNFNSYVRISFSIDRKLLQDALVLLKKYLNKNDKN